MTTLRKLNESDFSEIENCLPRPYTVYPPYDPSVLQPYALPSVLVPPEAIEMDALSPGGEETQVKKDEWPEYFPRLFPSDVSPDFDNPVGYVIRTSILDIVDIFEVNRKECARFLLEYPKWNLPGTFKPKPGSTMNVEPAAGKDWQLESTVIEVRLFLLLGDIIIDQMRADCSWRLSYPPRIREEVDILHRLDHGNLQALSIHCWSCCRQVYQTALFFARGWFGR